MSSWNFPRNEDFMASIKKQNARTTSAMKVSQVITKRRKENPSYGTFYGIGKTAIDPNDRKQFKKDEA